MKAVHFILLLALSTCLIFCKSDRSNAIEKAKKIPPTSVGNCPPFIFDNKVNNLNLSVFLDLSDRIIESKIIQKDSEYLVSISRAFTNHVKTKKLILLQDQMQLFFNPEPTNDTINNIAKKLRIQFSKNTPKSQIALTEQLYSTQPAQLYELAQADSNNAKDYPGSDIWRFFKDNVTDYAVSSCHRNILIILTDGYMFHENTQMKQDNQTSYLTPRSLGKLNLNNANWKTILNEKELGFIKANENLEDLEVLVIGIQSSNSNNPYALDIIREYWANWFNTMGIKKFKIQNADLASSVDKVIADFVNP